MVFDNFIIASFILMDQQRVECLISLFFLYTFLIEKVKKMLKVVNIDTLKPDTVYGLFLVHY